MGMHPTNPGRPGSELIADLSTRRYDNAFFFAGAIDVRGDELTMPVDELRRIGVVKDLDRDWLAFSQTDQRSWDLAIVADSADGLVLSDIDQHGADSQTHFRWSGLDRRRCGCRGHRHRVLRNGRGWEHETTPGQGASQQKLPS